VSISVVDDSGQLMLFQRMDGAKLVATDISMRKARTAVYFQGPTKDLEAEVAGGLVGADVPLADQPAVVPAVAQRLGVREGALAQVFEVADVPLVVRQQLVPERRLPGEQAGPGRRTDRRRRVPPVEAGRNRELFRQHSDKIHLAFRR